MTQTIEIPKNDDLYAVAEEFKQYNIKFYNSKEKPFRIYGVIWDENDGFIRIPKKVVEDAGNNLSGIYTMDAGGRVKFSSGSRYIAIKAIYNNSHWFAPGMGQGGSCGFDLYSKNDSGSYDHIQTFLPFRDNGYGFECVVDLYTSKDRDLIINFPIFAGVKELMIGIVDGYKLEKGSEYRNKKPVVFYGSSITHGAYANRPGSCYPALLSQKFNFDYINLGFSGGCKAEKPVLDYIASLDMCAFILDYDYNARSEEYLKDTHSLAYSIVREKHKDIPILMGSRPNYDSPEYDAYMRRNIVRDTYMKAKKKGENVYFVDGKKEFSNFARSGFTVDYTHPNDAGFAYMAKVYEKQIIKFLDEIK